MYRQGGMSTTLYLDQMRGFFITPTKRKHSQITICTKITQPKNLHAIARVLLFSPSPTQSIVEQVTQHSKLKMGGYTRPSKAVRK